MTEKEKINIEYTETCLLIGDLTVKMKALEGRIHQAMQKVVELNDKMNALTTAEEEAKK